MIEYRLTDRTGSTIIDQLDHRNALRFHHMLMDATDEHGKLRYPGLTIQQRTVTEWKPLV